MRDLLESIAESNEWVFKYARSDFQNLFDEIEQKDVIHIFLDPVEISKNKDEYGTTETIVYSGSFMMLYSSSYDEGSYDIRYKKYIKPIIDLEIEKIEDSLSCESGLRIDGWRLIEVINILDYNLDGLIVTFQVTQIV